jgi:hypothetical protein
MFVQGVEQHQAAVIVAIVEAALGRSGEIETTHEEAACAVCGRNLLVSSAEADAWNSAHPGRPLLALCASDGNDAIRLGYHPVRA